jgi:alpha-1,2-mannosyltransferase
LAVNERREERITTFVYTLGALALIVAGIYCAEWMLRPFEDKFALGDLAVYRAAGRAILDNESIYGDYVRNQLVVPLPFIYPPFAAMLAAPFAWLNLDDASVVWTTLTVVLLAAVVRVSFRLLLDRYGRAAPIAFVLVLGSCLALSPVQDHLRFGQVGVILMACCVFDCVTPNPRWPRGVLIGIATAVKLVPGIFIPYLWFSGRRRAALVATGTFGMCSAFGLAVAPKDSWRFFTDTMFEPTSPQFFANQSLEGVMWRMIGGPWRLLWLVAVLWVTVYGLSRAIAAHKSGDELRAVALVGLIGSLVSPISWIHHLVWIVPVLGVIMADGRNRRRAFLAFVVAGLFVARLPYIGDEEIADGIFSELFKDSYGLLCLALFVYLARGARFTRVDDTADSAATDTAGVPG